MDIPLQTVARGAQSGLKPRARAPYITKQNARAMVEHRKSIGKMGGRPKGALDKRTIAKIKTKEAFDALILSKLGALADDLLRNSMQGRHGCNESVD